MTAPGPVHPLTKVERAACRLLVAHRGIGLLMARLLDADDSVAISAVLVMAVDPGGRRATLDLLREVQALGDAGAGLLAPAEPAPPPVRVSRELPRTYPVGPARGGFDWVAVELPAGPPTLGRWDLARQLADGLVRGETTLVFPPGAVVTYSVEPPVAASLASVIHPAPIPDPTTVCVTVFTVDGGTLVVERMPVADADALVEAFRGPITLTNQVLTVTLDDCAVTHLARRQITRIDLDFDPSPPTAAEPPGPPSFSDLR